MDDEQQDDAQDAWVAEPPASNDDDMAAAPSAPPVVRRRNSFVHTRTATALMVGGVAVAGFFAPRAVAGVLQHDDARPSVTNSTTPATDSFGARPPGERDDDGGQQFGAPPQNGNQFGGGAPNTRSGGS